MNKILTILSLLMYGWMMASAQNYQIGDLYTAPDGSEGIVYYLHPDGSGGWVVALNDASTGCAWGDATDVPGLSNQNTFGSQQLLNDTAGYANTQTLRNYQNNSNAYAAGTVDFDHGWVLPSPAQLSMLYGQLPFVATAITDAGGTALAYTNYWCSAENSASRAWCVDFGMYYYSGLLDNVNKTTSCRVRAVRSFTNTITITYDTALTYQWNTGSTQPYINVNPSQTTTYTVTATTDYGCSNTAEQTVIVGTGSPQTIYDTVCHGAGYEANGFTLTAAETQTAGTLTCIRTLETAGCSSTLTLQLRVNEPVTSTISAIACESYTWNGVTYYEGGDYTQTFNCANGCDSVVTLHLTVADPPEVVVTASIDTICAGDSVVLLAQADIFPMPSLLVPTVAVGDILCTDGSIVKPSAWPVADKVAVGVVFYVDNTGEHGWAAHLHDQGTNIKWGGSGSVISTMPSYLTARSAIFDLSGLANTQAIRAAGDSITYPAAWAVDVANGWYLPAAGQLQLLMSEYVTMNVTLSLLEGTQFNSGYYWPSTQYNATQAWSTYPGGNMHSIGKNQQASNKVRSIRDF